MWAVAFGVWAPHKVHKQIWGEYTVLKIWVENHILDVQNDQAAVSLARLLDQVCTGSLSYVAL